ncbi:MAG: alpha-E domain-containing protein [Opitutus sp.]|nr:alpha-E domain-containing protein [Opitutus sp.]MCS6247387.1 alpha-E domain-containing protein [Opitutus sp.]MCS6273736.1 alpha-E domain-containing protein [Opitutus sp.]MCS6276135.1 alpha-E domain-containing protein [Opitutus sp.]MCS6301229.1 alpha-E domain-containing protein [Opitutus sp.]
MLSRVANLVYWMARYLERAENTARIVDVNAQLVLDLQSRQAADDPKSWEPLVYVTGDEDKFFELYGDAVTERAVIEFMLFDKRNPSSLISCIAFARENARCIRDQLSGDVWETLNTFYLKLKSDDFGRYAQLGSAEYLNRVKTQIQLLFGVADSMIPRTNLWWFFQLGRHLERADNTSRILDVKYYMLLPDVHTVGSALDMVQWASVLRSCSAFEAFRRSRRGQLNLERVVDYLLRDAVFPRSILFSIAEAEQSLAQITAEGSQLDDSPPSRLLRSLRVELEQIDVTMVIADGLHEFLDDVQMKISEIHSAIQETFVDYPTSGAQVVA